MMVFTYMPGLAYAAAGDEPDPDMAVESQEEATVEEPVQEEPVYYEEPVQQDPVYYEEPVYEEPVQQEPEPVQQEPVQQDDGGCIGDDAEILW